MTLSTTPEILRVPLQVSKIYYLQICKSINKILFYLGIMSAFKIVHAQ